MFHSIAIDRDRLWKHGFLVLLLGLLAVNIRLLIRDIHAHSAYPWYGNLFVTLLLILNHIAFCYTEQGGIANKTMKVVATLWIVPTFCYLMWAPW